MVTLNSTTAKELKTGKVQVVKISEFGQRLSEACFSKVQQ